MIEFLMSRLGIILTSGCGNDGVEHEEGSRHRWRRASVFAGILVAIKLEQYLCLLCAGAKRLLFWRETGLTNGRILNQVVDRTISFYYLTYF